MTTWINVNKQVVARNAKLGTNEPPIRVAHGKSGKPTYCHQVQIKGPSEIVYDANKPILKCGARLAIRTDAEVVIVK
jgi:hypothetical protein